MMGLPLIGFKNVCLLKYYKQTSGSRIIFVLLVQPLCSREEGRRWGGGEWKGGGRKGGGSGE